MLNCKSSWTRIADQEEDNFFRIHARKTGSEEEMLFFGFPPSIGEEERQGKVTC